MSQKCIHVVKWNILFSLKFEWYSDASELKFKNVFLKFLGHTVKTGRCLFVSVSTHIHLHWTSSLYINFFSMAISKKSIPKNQPLFFPLRTWYIIREKGVPVTPFEVVTQFWDLVLNIWRIYKTLSSMNTKVHPLLPDNFMLAGKQVFLGGLSCGCLVPA